MVTGRTGCGSNRKQIKEPFVIIVQQKRSWFFAIKDRFLKVRMVTFNQKGV